MVALLIFRSSAQIDIFFSNLFFTPIDCSIVAEGVRCGDFVWQHDTTLILIRWIGHEIPLYLMGAVCLHMTWLMMFNPNKTLADIYPPLVAIITGLVGPLLVVNLMLKEYWGRPRPVQTLFFGGDNPYIVPGDISNFCQSNCSFVSGEAAAAFWMLALMFYFAGRNRKRFLIVATVLAAAISFLRVIFGRHYISDVVTAGLISIFLIAFAVWLLQTPIVRRCLAAMLKFSNTYAFGRHKLRN
ncbi:MAG: phosphatase PAP2 family protein [Rhizobiaceae bacterium]